MKTKPPTFYPIIKLLSKPILISIITLLSAASAWCSDEDYFEQALTYTVEITSQIKTPFIEDSQGIYSGAGFLVDKERGWIVTNAHVASYSPAKIKVSFKDEDFIPGETVYVDRYLDLAVIKINPERILNDKTEVNLKCDGDLKIGHPVGAFGHPWDFEYTGTKGIISGKTSHFGNELLQTDAPINAGNSGGPLISLKTGEVVGINTSSYDSDEDQNTNFAEQVKFVCRVLELLKQEKDPSSVKFPFNFLTNSFKGRTMVVSNIYLNDGFIDLQVGDKIVKVIGYGTLKNEGDLIHALRGRSDNFSLEILRAGDTKIISGKLDTHDHIVNRKGVMVSGMLVSNYWFRDMSIMDLPKLNIHFVKKGSLAEGLLLESGEYLELIDGKSFNTLGSLYFYLKEREGKDIKIKTASTGGADVNYYLTHYEHILRVKDLKFLGRPPRE
jgi:S1-C subfamily serine protease